MTIDGINPLQGQQSGVPTERMWGQQQTPQFQIWNPASPTPQGAGTTLERTSTPTAAPDDKNLVQPSPHKVKKGWYPATSDANPAITGKDGILANQGQKIKDSKDPAGITADAVIGTKEYTAKTALEKNQVRKMIIAANPSVFNPDGSLKPNANLGKLDIPSMSYLLGNVDRTNPHRKPVPKGFYPAFSDKNGNINGLTESQLRQNEGSKGNGTVGAVQVMNALLKTKGAGFMSGERKAALLKDLCRKNPSVFNEDGSIKKNADLTKLDVPTLQYMMQTYSKLPDARHSKPVTFGNNGFYAVGKGADAKFYRANGIEITSAEFRIKCPSIHSNVTGA